MTDEKKKGGRPKGTGHPYRSGPRLPGGKTKKEKAAEKPAKPRLRKKPGESGGGRA